MKKIVIGGDYVALETSLPEDERRAMADEWDEVPTIRTEVYWPVHEPLGPTPIRSSK